MTVRCLQVANAGVNEIGDFSTPKVKNGKPKEPTVATLDINLLGSIYSKDDPFNDIRGILLICTYPSCTPSHPLFGTRTKVK